MIYLCVFFFFFFIMSSALSSRLILAPRMHPPPQSGVADRGLPTVSVELELAAHGLALESTAERSSCPQDSIGDGCNGLRLIDF